VVQPDLEHPHPEETQETPEGEARFREARKVTLAGAALRSGLAAVELILGVAFGSRALIADTAHTLSDLVSDAVVFVALQYASRPGGEAFPFGRGKVETLAALAVSAMLAAAGVGIAVEAGAALAGGTPAPVSPWALAGAALGIVVQETCFRWTLRVGRRIRSQALVANAWHQRSDALSSVAALLGIAGSSLFDAGWLDPVAAVVVAGMILRVAFDLLRESFRGLLDVSVPAALRDRIKLAAVSDPAVAEVHDLRARHVGHEVFVDLHAVVHPQMTVTEACAVAHRVEDAVKATAPEVRRVLVHVEPAREGAIIPVPAPGRPTLSGPS
jgi:cation diffusion facilitator family transporter